MTTRELHLAAPGSLEQWTGGYVYDTRMVEGLRRLGWRVVVHNLDGAFPDADETARTSVACMLDRLGDDTRIVIDGLALAGLSGPVRARCGRLRLVALIHHPLADETGLGTEQRDGVAALEREALACCAGAVVTSQFTAERLASYGVSADRVRVARPGTARAGPAAGPRAGDPPQLLCVGSVIPRKGQDVLVRALARLDHLAWRCVCVGSLSRDGEYADAVRRQARACGLADRVRFVGDCDSATLDRVYDTSSVFVLPSYYEGYGMVLTEALARGLPVVSTTGGAIPGTVPRDAALLVPPGDDRALADTLISLLADGGAGSATGRRAALATAARRHAVTLPDWDEAAAVFADAILALTPAGPAESDAHRARHTDVRRTL